MVDYRPLLFINALALMLLVTAGFASIQRDGGSLPEASARTSTSPATTTPVKMKTGEAEPAPASASAIADENDIFADIDDEDTRSIDNEAPSTLARDGTENSSPSPEQDDRATLVEPFTIESEDTPVSRDTPNESVPASDSQSLAVAEPRTDDPGAEPHTPTPTLAKLTLRSNVMGDAVQINGQAYGSTRLDLDLKPGNYDVLISKTGYKTWSQTVRLDAGDNLTVHGELEQYTRVNYEDGQWVGNVRTGEGAYVDDTGLEYTGHFVDGQFDGAGVARYPNGGRYEGNWSMGVRTDDGTFRAPDGSTYDGQFADDEFNGKGTLTRTNGDVLTGQWSDGRLNGHGSLTTADGMLYVGSFKNGLFHGEGTLTYPDGHHYEGGFSNGEFHGEGSEIFADGKKYVGQYIEGQFHGKGTLMNPNGSSIEATFRYGEPYGQAKLVTPEGEVFNARTSEPGVCYREKSYRATQCPPLEGW